MNNLQISQQKKELQILLEQFFKEEIPHLICLVSDHEIIVGLQNGNLKLFDTHYKIWINIDHLHQELYSIEKCQIINDSSQTLNNCIAVTTADERVRIYDYSNSKILKNLKLENFPLSLCTASYSSENVPQKFLIIGDSVGNVVVLDTKFNRENYKSHSDSIKSIFFDKDNAQIISGANDSQIKITDFQTKKIINSLKGHLSNQIYQVIKLPQPNNLLVSISEDQTIKLWTNNIKKCVQTLYGHYCAVRSVCAVEKEFEILTGDRKGQIKLWDLRMSKCVDTFADIHNNLVYALKYDKGTKQVHSCARDNYFKIWC